MPGKRKAASPVYGVEDWNEYANSEAQTAEDDTDDVEPRIAPKSTSIRLGSYTTGPLDIATGQRSALPITNDPDTLTLMYDEDGPPADGLSYLRAVRREAEGMPSFVTIERKGAATVYSNQLSDISRGNDQLIQKNWHQYIMSQYRFSRSLLEMSYETLDTELSRKDLPVSLATWREYIRSPDHPPTMTLLSLLEQEDVFRLFRYFHRWITPNISVCMSRWLFALLVRAADLVPANEVSILRQLAQKCISVRLGDKVCIYQTISF
ncbi:survival motor neuron interacting protein 1-domain-containing protein [Lipomyces arxii]|uniref:survival motor neuron interacting protein 1-domain-containing protein n=1 Tax=Lipomyces arxii TaxID=56418 RepID=UPI0034CF64CA